MDELKQLRTLLSTLDADVHWDCRIRA